MRSLLLILLLPILAVAQDYDLKSKAQARVKGKKKAKVERAKPVQNPPAQPVEAAPALTPEPATQAPSVTDPDYDQRMEARAKAPKNPVKWGSQISYSIRTDMADQVKPRLYQHSLSLSSGFQHVPSKMSVTGILSAGYESAGEARSEVLVDENDTELFVNDFTLAVQKSWELDWKSDLSFTLGNEFPTSPESKREGYGSVTSMELGWSVPLVPKKLSVSLSGEVYYIWNSYEYSPATGDLNKQGGARAEAGVRWTIWKGWYVRAGAGSQTAQYLDGTKDVTYRNSLGTGYNFGTFSVALSTSNGTYLDKEDSFIWFVDDYRRTASLAVTYSF